MKRRGFLGSIIAAFVAKPVLEALPPPVPLPEPMALVVPEVIEVKPPIVVNDIPHWTQCTCGPCEMLDVTSHNSIGGFYEFIPGLRSYCAIHTPIQYRQQYVKSEDARLDAEIAGPSDEEDKADWNFDYYPDEYPNEVDDGYDED